MSVKYSPFGNSQISDASGNPAVGWTIGTYTAGSSARLASYTDATGSTAQTADIVLNALGLPTNGQIWLTAGSSYKFIVKNAAGVTQFTVDGISGVNDTSIATFSQWPSSGLTPTFVSTTSFTVPGDQTTELHVGRRLQFTTTAGTVYGTIATTAFAALTTVTMTMDAAQVLDSGLSVVNLSLLRNDHSALPGVSTFARTYLDDADATTTRATISAAKSGANSDITSLSGLTTALTKAQGGTGNTTGSIPLGQLSAATANSGYPQSGTGGETLRTIRGSIASTGAITTGGGFTVTKGGTGDYAINFASSFSSAPSVVATSNTTGIIAAVGAPSTSGVQVSMTTNTSVGFDVAFQFIAIGPS